jgi:hypothetical protein
MTKMFYKVQENFLRRDFVKDFLAAVLLVLPDIFQHWCCVLIGCIGQRVLGDVIPCICPVIYHGS